MSPLLEQLVDALRCLPGVGAKTAQRMAFHLLQRNRQGGRQLADALMAAMDGIGRCEQCQDLSETEICRTCANPQRDRSKLCVVETPVDVLALEQSTGYQGLYFVLMGRLSPLDGIGPQELGLDRLEARLSAGEAKEMIIATNPTIEGEATAHYLAGMAADHKVSASRLAHGVPIGGELEYLDRNTLAHAFAGRQELK